MKSALRLSLWLLIAAVSTQVPSITYAKVTQEEREDLRKKYNEAKALYEKRKKEKAPASELARLKKDMKIKRSNYILGKKPAHITYH